MDNMSLIEQFYKKYTKDIGFWAPEGITYINLKALHSLNLLKFEKAIPKSEEGLTRFFQVIESSEKITLINDQFVIWIVPENKEGTAITYTLIALNSKQGPHLEVVFATSGVYNSSHLVLRILERYLIEIQETEDLIKKYQTG